MVERVRTIIFEEPWPWISQAMLKGPPRSLATGHFPLRSGSRFHIVEGYEGCLIVSSAVGKTGTLATSSVSMADAYTSG